MGTVLAVLGVLAVLFVAALVATRDGELLVDAPRDHADLDLPVQGPVRAADLDQVRFGMALRGYRMAEVDALLDRLAAELRERDDRLAALAEGPMTEGPGAEVPGAEGPGAEGPGVEGPGVEPLPPVVERPGADLLGPGHSDQPAQVPSAPDGAAPYVSRG